MKAVLKGWNRFWFEPGLAWVLGLCRLVLFGGVFLWQLDHDFAAWGQYSDVFWMPIWLFDRFNIPQLSPAALGAMAVIWKTSLFLSAIGWFTRFAMVTAFALGTYLMGLPHNFGQTQHFDALVVFVTGAFALSRAGDAVSVDALIAAGRRPSVAPPRDSGEYTWPIRFVWVAMALIFCAAGISKLRRSGLDWIFSDNLSWLLIRQQYSISDGDPLTTWGVYVAQHPLLYQGMAAAAVTVETLFPLVLFSGLARAILVPLGLAFLVGIRILMGPTFEQFMVCYVFWVPWARVGAALQAHIPVHQSRLVIYDGACGLCSRTVVVLARLDLLGRLKFADTDRDSDWIAATHPTLNRTAYLVDMHVVTDAGKTFAGFNAYRSMAWVLPVAWLTLPLWYVPGVPALGRRVYAFVASHRHTATCARPLASTAQSK